MIKDLFFRKKNPQDLTQKIINLINLQIDEKQVIGEQLRNKVIRSHNLNNLINRIINEYEKK